MPAHILCMFVCTIVLYACEQATPPSGNSAVGGAELIDTFGTYRIRDIEIAVFLKAGTAIVQFEVRSAHNAEPMFSGDVGSDWSRWSLFWSDNDELWVNSSDVGVYVWQKEKNGVYERSVVTSDLVPLMPSPVFDTLPSVLRKDWQGLRGTETREE